MIEPQDVSGAAPVDDEGVPAAIAGDVAGLQRPSPGKSVRPPSVERATRMVVAPAFAPHADDHRRVAAGRRCERDARRQLAAEPRLATGVIDAHRRGERAPAVTAGGEEHIGTAARRRRTPRDGDEVAGGSDRRKRVDAIRDREPHRIVRGRRRGDRDDNR